MKMRSNNSMPTFYAIKCLAIASLAVLMVGCSSGGSSGTVTGSNQTNIAEVGSGTGTGSEANIDANSNELLIEQPELNWTACVNQPSLECASLLVPLDYSNPEGKSISVAMARKQADQTTASRTLFFNPGGPGAVGIDSLQAILRFGVISTSMKQTFNFVSFDPRGIGASESVKCDETEIFAQNPYPIDRAAVEFNYNKVVSFAQGCADSKGDVIQHLGSYNVVRDINEMRKALGLSQIDFLGYSYGTRLAALYMQTYPQSTGRFVLDGSMKPEPGLAPLVFGALLPGQANINRLTDACIGTPIVCAPEKFAIDLQRRVDELAAQPASQESSLLVSLLQFASTNPGFEQILIGSLARYLDTQKVEELIFLDSTLGISEAAESNFGLNTTALVAVMCADDPTRPTVDSLDALRLAFNAESDLLAETQLNTAGMCAGWPESIDPIPQIATNQAPASLIIGGPSDAQTPLLFAEQMAAAVGGQFLRSEHDGHTTVFSPENNCTNSVVETFLLTGNLPTTAVCEADVNPIASAPDWRDEIPKFVN